MKQLTITIFLLAMLLPVSAQVYEADWSSLDTRPIPSWFEDAKFGIFIHWGVYSVPAYRPLEEGLYASYAEWYYAKVYQSEKNGGKEFHAKNYGESFSYRDFAPLFTAELWEPGEWAELFEKAGAKYVVLTSKHHDGFCLWPTKSPYKKNWNSMDTGPGRDLVGELSEAVRDAGMRMGLYYSIIEWESSWTNRTETGYYIPMAEVEKYKIPEDEYVDNHLIPQLKEIITEYQPSLVFADGGEWDGTVEQWKTLDFLSWLYTESPVKNEVVVNDRFAKGMPGNHGDYYSSEYSDANLEDRHPWEESRGIGGSYGYNRAENIDDYNTSEELIHELISIISRGGNLLLNVGPTADGRIPVIMQQRLLDVGEWLGVNSEAIYHTRQTDLAKGIQENILFTSRGNSLYGIITEWPTDVIKIKLESNTIKVEDVSMLGIDYNIRWQQIGDILSISLPLLTIDKLPCIYAWSLRIKIKPI